MSHDPKLYRGPLQLVLLLIAVITVSAAGVGCDEGGGSDVNDGTTGPVDTNAGDDNDDPQNETPKVEPIPDDPDHSHVLEDQIKFREANVAGPGTIIWAAFDYTPRGFTRADGRLMDPAERPRLSESMAQTYGSGSEGLKLKLPDVRGRRLVGGNEKSIGGTTHDGLPAGEEDENVHHYLALNPLVQIAGEHDIERPYIGSIMIVAFDFAPRDWAFCHGQMIDVKRYPSLFKAIGTTFGGDGEKTFALPDLKERLAVGAGQVRNMKLAFGQKGTLQNAGDNDAPLATGLQYVIAMQGVYPMESSGEDAEAGGILGQGMLGQIVPHAGTAIPRNWLPCDGRILPIKNNTALYSLLGTKFGGNGRTTFALPDLRLRTPIGAAGATKHGAKQDWKPGSNAPVGSLHVNYLICVQGQYPSRS